MGGGGCGATSPQSCGAAGGSGVVIVRYTDPSLTTPSGVGATSTHTHTVTNGSTGTASNLPPYLTMIFAKANSSVYVTNANILISSELPPLGWSRVSQLDNKFTMGSTTYGTSGGYATHSHSATLSTAAPSATMNIYGSGTNYADSGHTHECVGTSSASNLPPYYSVLYIKRKISQEAYLLSVPSVPRSLYSSIGNSNVTLEWVVPSSNGGATITDYIIEYSGNNGSTWTIFEDGVSSSRSATVTGLTNGETYIFRVAAVNSVGTGPYSSTVSGTPVNLSPSFTNIVNDSPTDLGSVVRWEATASDSDGSVKLLICKTQAISGGGCVGGVWCSSPLHASNPSCSFTVPSAFQDGEYAAYAYIIDNQGGESTGVLQGSNSSFTVNPAQATISSISINNGNTIILEEATTKTVPITATVSTPNGCSTITEVKASIYRSGVTYASCDTSAENNKNNCYAEVSCTQDPETCIEGLGSFADYTCNVNMHYYADPTVAGTEYPSENWLVTIKAITGTVTTQQIAEGVEVDRLLSISTDSAINYGVFLVGESNNVLDKAVAITSTGNVGLDVSVSSVGDALCVDYPTCIGGTPIGADNQRYSTSSGTTYNLGEVLGITQTSVGLKLPKMRGGTVPSKNIYWGILIPNGTYPGIYIGEVGLTAILNPISDW